MTIKDLMNKGTFSELLREEVEERKRKKELKAVGQNERGVKHQNPIRKEVYTGDKEAIERRSLEERISELPAKQKESPLYNAQVAVFTKQYRCPYCSHPISDTYRASRCPICGTRFSGIPYHAHARDKALVAEWLIPTFLRALERYNISMEEIEEMFSSLSLNIPIAPWAFFSAIETAIKRRWWIRDNFEDISFPRILRFSIDEINDCPTIISSISDIEERLKRTFSRTYDQYVIDACAGGGWLPPYDFPVAIVPYKPAIYKDGYCCALACGLREEDLREKKAAESNWEDFYCYNIILSDKDGITPSQMEQFWSSLQDIRHRVIFEIVGNGGKQKIAFQFFCHSDDISLVGNKLISLFPNSSINTEEDDYDYFREFFFETKDEYTRDEFFSDYQCFARAFGLLSHYSYPLRTFTSFNPDPLSGLMGPLADLDQNEGIVIQALVSPTKGWQKRLEWIRDLDKEHKERSGFKDCPAEEKLRYPLFAVCLKVLSFGKRDACNPDKIADAICDIERALSVFSAPGTNSIVSGIEIRDGLVPEEYNNIPDDFSRDEFWDILDRNTYRHGFILNSEELASLLHFPSKALQHPKLLRQEEGIKEAPEEMTKGGLLIGINVVHGKEQEVYVPEDYRFRHIYVVGKTGTGKTTLLLNMIKSDIDAGKGVGVIDPHGDLVRDKILPIIPEHRINDVILFDPTDFDHPIGFNMLQVHSEIERRQIMNEITATLRRLFEQWSSDINTLFRNSVTTLLADRSQTYTLLDIRKLITDDYFRSEILERVDDEYLREFWAEDFEGMRRTTVPAVKRRLSTLLGQPEVRAVLGQRETTFNVREMMDSNKILLANIPRGELGEEVSTLFGGLLVSKIQLTAMARASQVEEARVPFYLYVDEFQNFTNESFDIILSEARKYRLCLTMAHQFTAQLSESIRESVFGNVGSIISFELGVKDATSLAKELDGFTVENILDLPKYQAYTRIGRARDAFSMRTFPPPKVTSDFSAEIRRRSRERYCGKPESIKAKPKPDEQAPQQKQEEEDEDKWFQ